MLIQESVIIQATAEKVWKVLTNFEKMPEWNHRLKKVWKGAQREGDYPAKMQLDYQMGNSRLAKFEALVAQWEPNHRLYFEMKEISVQSSIDRPAKIIEKFELIEHEGKTKVLHEVEVRQSNIPWYVRWLIGLINRFGRPVGKGPLDQLKILVEQVHF